MQRRGFYSDLRDSLYALPHSLDSLDISAVDISSPNFRDVIKSANPLRIRSLKRLLSGRIAELLVARWMDSCPLVEVAFPSISSDSAAGRRGYYITAKEHQAKILDPTGRCIAEYEGFYQSPNDFEKASNHHLLVAEVKAGDVELFFKSKRGKTAKVEDRYRLACQIEGGKNLAYLFFASQDVVGRKRFRELQERFPYLECIDLGYSEKRLKRYRDEIFSELETLALESSSSMPSNRVKERWPNAQRRKFKRRKARRRSA